MKGSRRNKIFTSPSQFGILVTSVSANLSPRPVQSFHFVLRPIALYIIKMAAAASSDLLPTAPTTVLAALSSEAAALSGLLASTEFGCPEVSTHPSALLILPGASNCMSGPRSHTALYRSSVDLDYHYNCPDWRSLLPYYLLNNPHHASRKGS